ILAVCILLLTVNIIYGVLIMRQSGNAMKTMIGRHMISLAETAAAMINGDELKTLTADETGSETFQRISDDLMAAVDKGDSADFTLEEILNPSGWVLLHFLMDARTGLGRFHDFRISNYALMMELIDYCMDHTIDEILELPDVKERCDLYFEQAELFKAQLLRIAKVYDKVVVLDLRNEEIIYAGNRFMIYALFPETQISIHVAWGFKKQNTAVMIGKSIINKASQVDIGELCLTYGGGGHHNAGTCQLSNETVDAQLPDIIAALNQ
ncbi:MAG: hypothetical protein ACSW8H_04235, partial [bacterium]